MFPVKSFLIKFPPNPVTTTSFSAFTSGANSIIKLLEEATNCFGSKPKPVTTRVAPDFTFKVNEPSLAVLVPFLVPLSKTEAPDTGTPFSSITFPVTEVVCAYPTKANKKAQTTINILFLM